MNVEPFRADARAWLREHADPHSDQGDYLIEGGTKSLEESRRFQRAAWEAGYVARHWPVDYGGRGLADGSQRVFDEEAQWYALDNGPFLIGLRMVGPTILELGTDAQKSRYLPPLLKGEEVWCQLFSEPDAGSDLASLRTTAVKDGDSWVINGQKVWTSGAQWSDLGAILARTSPDVPKHCGITMFVVDMRHPGIDVRPLKVATGDTPFNEVYLDDVAVPADAVIGQVGGGWAAALVTLQHEREAIGMGQHPMTNPLGFEQLRAMAHQCDRMGDVGVRRGLAALLARESGIASFGQLLREEMDAGLDIGARGSVAKLATAELGLSASDLALEICGPQGVLGHKGFRRMQQAILIAPGLATGGGSNEIQRNIIAERVLGLPRELSPDRDAPFSERVRTK